MLLGAGWAGWQYWLAPRAKAERLPPAAAASAAPTPAPRPPLSAVAAPQTTLADTVGATDAAQTAPETPLPRGVAPPADAGAADEASEGAPVAAAATPLATAAGPTPARDAAPDRSAPAVEPMPAEEGATPRPVGQRHRLDRGNRRHGRDHRRRRPLPRGVVELLGDRRREGARAGALQGARASLPQVEPAGLGTAAVAGIRTGWHDRPGGAEQHIVIDLAGAGVRLEGFESLGSRIVLKLAVR